MQTMINTLKSAAVLLIALTSTIAVNAQKKKYEFAHSKNVSQTYPVSSSDELVLDNQFGDIIVHTWNRSEVKVDIVAEISSNVKEFADEMFGRLDFKNSKDGNRIIFRTKLNDTDRKDHSDGKNSSNEISINYEVSMPASLALDLHNKFGKVVLPDLSGRTDIVEEFGSLTTGRLTNSHKITVKFGSAEFGGLENADLDLQFLKGRTLLKNVSGTLDLNTNFCKTDVVVFAGDLSRLSLKANFSNVGLVVPKDASASFEAKTDWGSLKNETAIPITSESEQRARYSSFSTTNLYKGTAGSGKSRYSIYGNFSNFVISHEMPAESDYPKGQPKRSRII